MRTFEFGNFVRELARNIPMELQTNVRFGSIASNPACLRHVRFSPNRCDNIAPLKLKRDAKVSPAA
jgi:hypothetical protein